MRFRLLFIFLLGTLLSKGQAPYFEQFSVKDGLPSAVIFCVHQTPDGHIWLGTNNGVARFDGSTFRNYSYSDSLTALAVIGIYESQDEGLYFWGLGNQIFKYDPLLDRMYRYNFPREVSLQFRRREIISMVELQDGRLKLGFNKNKGAGIVDREGNFEALQDSTQAGLVLEDHQGQLLYYQDGKRGDTIFTAQGNSAYTRNNSAQINGLKIDEEYAVLGHGNQLLLIKNGALMDTLMFEEPVIATCPSEGRSLWCGVKGEGAIRFSIRGDSLHFERQVLKGKSVTGILEDHEGGYWFSTLGSGVQYTTNLDVKFYAEEYGLSGIGVSALSGKGDDEVLVGFINRTLTLIQGDSLTVIDDLPKQDIKSAAVVNEIIYDQQQQQYYIAAIGVYVYNEDGLSPLLEDVNANFKELCLVEDGSLWLGGRGNTALVNVKEGKVIKTIKAKSFVNDIEDCGEHGLLAAMWGSVDYIGEDTLQPFAAGNDMINRAFSITAAPDNGVLFSRLDGGLGYMNQRDTFELRRDQSYGDNVFNDARVREGKIYAITSLGLEEIELKAGGSSHRFSREVGIFQNDHRHLYLGPNRLWIGTGTGLYSINYSDLVKITPPAPLLLAMTTADSSYSLTGRDSIEFRWDESELTLNFKTISFRYRGEFQYQYRIDPTTEEYKTINGNQLNLSGLTPGDYAILVRTITDSGMVSSPTVLNIRVLTPFWQTWWFIALMALLLIVLMALITRKFVAIAREKERERARERELINVLRLQSIQAQFNPHFTSNAMNSIQSHISADTIDEAKEYLAMFSSMMRSILINTERETITLTEEINMLTTYLQLEQLRFGEKLQYEFDIGDSVDPDFDRIPPMILQPIVENAINHGIFNSPTGGFVRITLETKGDCLIATIEDNGIGRAASGEVKKRKKTTSGGKGTGLVRERLNMVNRDTPNDFETIDLFADGKAIGTRVILKVELHD